MGKVFLQTKYNKHKKFVEEIDGKLVSEFLEVNNGPSLVDKAFIPAKVQIEQSIAAGEQLHAFKLAQYHAIHPEEIPDDYYDPLCIPNYDPTDAQQDLQRIAASAATAKKKYDAMSEEEKKARAKLFEEREVNVDNKEPVDNTKDSGKSQPTGGIGDNGNTA